jgi:FtsP/CotA-like multicopper oxidase with cupredoxin domain
MRATDRPKYSSRTKGIEGRTNEGGYFPSLAQRPEPRTVIPPLHLRRRRSGPLWPLQCAGQSSKHATQPYPIDTVFDNNNPPAIITTQGTVEKWIIQNHARENHEFHQHQIHFMVLEQDNFEANGSHQAPAINGRFLDMVEVPFRGGPPPQTGGIEPPACVWHERQSSHSVPTGTGTRGLPRTGHRRLRFPLPHPRT